MKKFLPLLLSFSIFSTALFGQMWNGQDSLYGNEWIDYAKDYYKIMVAEDGLYRIPQQVLQNAGVSAGVKGAEFRLMYLGEEIPIFTSTNNTFAAGDFIEFYGKRNRSELDQHLYLDPEEEMLNPDYSLFTDTSAYFLTWDSGSGHQRVETQSNSLNNLPTAEAYYMHEELMNIHEFMVQEITSQGIAYSSYEGLEGFASSFRRNRTFEIPSSAVYNSGPASSLAIRMVTSSTDHQVQIKWNNKIIISEAINGFQFKRYQETIANSTLVATNKLKVFGEINAQDRLATAQIVLTYPRSFDFSGQSAFHFNVEGASVKKYVEVTNFEEGGSDPILYDITNNKRLIVAFDNGSDLTRIGLPPGTGNRKLLLANTSNGIKTIENIEQMSFVDLTASDANYVILSHPVLYEDGNGQNWVQEYANYRASNAGGAYQPQIVDIQQVYDQFAYGIHRNPISIRNFGNYIKKSWTDPQYFFIIGKAREYAFARSSEDLALDLNESFLVPTFGVPGADNLLLSSNTSSVPVIPIGRVAVSNPNELKIFLDKIRTLEGNINLPQTYAERAWQKRILHLSGGDPTIQASIAGYLKSMEDIIETNKFGADVTTFYKTSTDPVQISESEEIFELINNGVSILTFFGHSGVETFDFNIDNPDNYFNFGKYPLMFSLGCFSGNIHTSSNGISERFVFYEDKGAIAFIASTGQGFISVLRSFAQRYYDLLGDEMYGAGIGDVMQKTLAAFDANKSLSTKTLHQQFTLHGDPAMRLNPRPGPDYVVDASTVSFEPTSISSVLDSFTINFEINNIGRNLADSFWITIDQQLPTGDYVNLILKKVEAPGFGNQLTYRVPNFGVIAAGQNRIFITIDTNNDIDELPAPFAEANNELYSGNGVKGVSLFITDNSAKTIYPKEFDIVNETQVMLKSSTRNTMVREQKYIYQIDTTELFNSSMLRSTEITQIGGVVEWTPDVAFQNGRVYYWRISPDSTDAQVGYVWDSSSFLYLEGAENGWNQSHFYQYKKDQLEGMDVKIGEEFDFWVNGFFITIKNKVKEPNSPGQYIYNFDTPASSIRPWDYLESGVSIVVADSITGKHWINSNAGDYGSLAVNGLNRFYAFPTSTTAERALVIEFLENVIPSNNYVYFFTILQNFNEDFEPEEWGADSLVLGKNIFQVLEAQGARLVRGLEDRGSVPYTVMYKKDRELFDEDIAETKEEETYSEVFLPILRTDGTIQSTLIGPASDWGEVSWAFTDISGIEDTLYIDIIGIDNLGNEHLLAEDLENSGVSLDFVDPLVYPYLKLQLDAKDVVNRTSPNLDYWRVMYEGIPEASVNPAKLLQVYNDTLQQGEIFSFQAAIENIGDYGMDSLLVKYVLSNNANAGENKIEFQRLPPLEKGSTLELNYQTPTRDLAGLMNFTVEVNPAEDQAELYHFNNYANYQFLVDQDKRNPLMDVTFDGVHIMDGDIVSSKPDILISLKDENPFLLLEDTALVKIYLTDPLGSQRQIYFTGDTARFYPPSNDKNRAIIEVNPELQMDGVYELIVQAQDVTGNQSGGLDYKISFEVINKKSISNVLNYPNPFSTSTQFVYTLTGDETPHHFKIQIFTVSGRIVKEITEQELGPLRVGTHRTDYTWDGTDDYGQRLANGVYLYRVVAKNIDGEDYERYETSANQFFQDDFGKLVILR